jgi:hypothetical protein
VSPAPAKRASTRAKSKAAPKRDRSGYYTHPDTGERYLSVTTILSGGIPKPALVHWSAWEAASCAVDNIPALVKARGEAARQEIRTWIQRASERKRDKAADLGTIIHGIVEARVLGQPTPELTDEQAPFVAAFDRFLDDWQPEYEATELVVANTVHCYAGTLDAKIRLASVPDALAAAGYAPGDLLECDYKTGKAVYPEVGPQLAAYRRADVGWLKDGTQVDPPATSAAVVLHIRPKDMPGGEPLGYALRPVDTGDPVFDVFLAAQVITGAARTDSLFDHILGEPLSAPDRKAVA